MYKQLNSWLRAIPWPAERVCRGVHHCLQWRVQLDEVSKCHITRGVWELFALLWAPIGLHEHSTLSGGSNLDPQLQFDHTALCRRLWTMCWTSPAARWRWASRR